MFIISGEVHFVNEHIIVCVQLHELQVYDNDMFIREIPEIMKGDPQ